MTKHSAGILLYRPAATGYQVLLVHPGGPFWAKKDVNAWSIPKGEFDPGEDAHAAAKREFAEEVGHPAPTGDYIDLGEVKQSSGKLVRIFALEHDFDLTRFASNTFEMEWPPKSGQTQTFAECDKAEWIPIARATRKLVNGQALFIERLAERLGVQTEADLQTRLI